MPIQIRSSRIHRLRKGEQPMESCLIRDVEKPFHERHHKFLTVFKRLRIPRDKWGDSCIPHYILEGD